MKSTAAKFISGSRLSKAVSIFSFMILCSEFAWAGNATVEVKAKKGSSDKHVEVTFSTIPKEGLKINADGPWKLEIKAPGTLKFDRLELKRSDWQESIGGFTLLGVPGKDKSTSLKFKMTAFMCTTDKSQCYRDVIEESVTVSW